MQHDFYFKKFKKSKFFNIIKIFPYRYRQAGLKVVLSVLIMPNNSTKESPFALQQKKRQVNKSVK
jgi:hypothetical protein